MNTYRVIYYCEVSMRHIETLINATSAQAAADICRQRHDYTTMRVISIAQVTPCTDWT